MRGDVWVKCVKEYLLKACKLSPPWFQNTKDFFASCLKVFAVPDNLNVVTLHQMYCQGTQTRC